MVNYSTNTLHFGDEDFGLAMATRATSATHFGCLTEFQPETDSIKSYLERVQLYFTANTVPRDKQVPILLSAIGAPIYSLLSDLLSPDLPSSKLWNAVLDKNSVAPFLPRDPRGQDVRRTSIPTPRSSITTPRSSIPTYPHRDTRSLHSDSRSPPAILDLHTAILGLYLANRDPRC